jgi:glucokinase
LNTNVTYKTGGKVGNVEKSRVAVRTVAGIDIGGTKVTFILWSGNSITYRAVRPYAARSSREFTDLILEGVRDLRLRATDTGTTVVATGIGCAGMVDQKRGFLLFSPNMPEVRDVALADVVSAATGAPAYLENDANCAPSVVAVS